MNFPRLLLLDDDEELRVLVRSLLGERYDISEAATLAEARELLALGTFAVGVIDGRLPDGTGIELIDEIRANDTQMCIVFISHFWRDLQSFFMLTKKLGVQRVINKPFAPQHFLTQFESAIDPPDPKDSGKDSGIRDAPKSVASGSAFDDRMEAMRMRFADKLVERLRSLGDLVRRLEHEPEQVIDELRMQSHKLHGTAGSYGFSEIGLQAGRIEMLITEVIEQRVPLDPERRRGMEQALAQAREALARFRKEERSKPVPRPSNSDSGVQIATVLVADSDPDFVAELESVGREKLIRVAGATTEEAALEQARSRHLDAALIDLHFGGDALTWSDREGEFAFRFARLLRSIDGLSDLPLAFIAPDGGRVFDRISSAHAGGSLFLTKPLAGNDFAEAVRQLVALRHEEPAKVLLVDDDEDCAEPLLEIFGKEDMTVVHLADPSRVLDALAELQPDILLLDVMMPVLNGFDVCRMLRATPQWRDLPIMLMAAADSAKNTVTAFEAGADDYITKPFSSAELKARVGARLARARLQRIRADRDPLTGLLLRRPFSETLAIRMTEALRHRRPLALCLIDLDHFKQVNDTYGHLAGDRVLAAMGRLLSQSFRSEDTRGRWGGEEFCVAFYDEPPEMAAEILGRAKDEFARLEFRGDHGELFHARFSAGISGFPQDGQTLEELLRVADQRLYDAKQRGRDLIVTETATELKPVDKNHVDDRPGGEQATVRDDANNGDQVFEELSGDNIDSISVPVV